MKYTIVDIPQINSPSASKWAREIIGKSKGPDKNLTWSEMIWYCRYVTTKDLGVMRYYFRNSEDATLFALKWA